MVIEINHLLKKSIENEKDLFYSYNNHIRYFLEYKKNIFSILSSIFTPQPLKKQQ